MKRKSEKHVLGIILVAAYFNKAGKLSDLGFLKSLKENKYLNQEKDEIIMQIAHKNSKTCENILSFIIIIESAQQPYMIYKTMKVLS